MAEGLKCCMCKNGFTYNPVEHRAEQEDVNNKDVPTCLCVTCYTNRCEDI